MSPFTAGRARSSRSGAGHPGLSRAGRLLLTGGTAVALAAATVLAAVPPAQAQAPAVSPPSPGLTLYTCQGGDAATYPVPAGVTHVLLSLAGGAGAGDPKDSSAD